MVVVVVVVVVERRKGKGEMDGYSYIDPPSLPSALQIRGEKGGWLVSAYPPILPTCLPACLPAFFLAWLNLLIVFLG